ncbi:uncharacterized protein CCR75_005760 [Bremia lactucae]|uniref:Uncharacterized protein n=1 Tax=Bremia lactucae TaxID=4779 RepID=A0A976FGH1_BRELC|nr:hypothetical protein CCR75_005760 [Bremia lactucae]
MTSRLISSRGISGAMYCSSILQLFDVLCVRGRIGSATTQNTMESVVLDNFIEEHEIAQNTRITIFNNQVFVEVVVKESVYIRNVAILEGRASARDRQTKVFICHRGRLLLSRQTSLVIFDAWTY